MTQFICLRDNFTASQCYVISNFPLKGTMRKNTTFYFVQSPVSITMINSLTLKVRPILLSGIQECIMVVLWNASEGIKEYIRVLN